MAVSPSSADHGVNAPDRLELPSAHLELTWRSLTMADVEPLAELLLAVQRRDHPALRLSALRLGEQLNLPWLSLADDTLGGFDADGVLRAYGLACVPPDHTGVVTAYLTGAVHPEWRGLGIGRALIRWQEGRARQLLAATAKGMPCRIAAFVDESRPERRRLYLAAGFSPKRWYQLLGVSLKGEPVRLPVPKGIRIDDCGAGHREAAELVQDNRFVDLWGSDPFASATWLPADEPDDAASGNDEDGGEQTDPRVCLVALDGSGTPVGFLHGSTAIGEDGQLGSIAWFGVLPAWRHKGIGSALVASALIRFRAAGLSDASLAVDADYDLNASPVFTRLGFRPTGRSLMYTIEL